MAKARFDGYVFLLNIFNLVNMKTATERYESFLQKSVAAGTVEKLDGHAENRKHPRLRIPDGLLKAEEILLRELTDISLGGFAFESARPFKMRESVTVNLHGKMLVSAQVAGCEMFVNGVNSAKSRFRTRCKFKDEEEAMVLLSLVLEIDQSETKKRTRGEDWA